MDVAEVVGLVFALSLVPAFVGGAVGQVRRCGAGPGFAAGLLLSWVGVLLVALLSPRTPQSLGRVQCPACREWIDKDARVCPHCRSAVGSPTG